MIPVGLIAALGGAFITGVLVAARGAEVRGRAYEAHFAEIRAGVIQMSVDEARLEAMQMLSNDELFRVKRSRPTRLRPDLGPELVAFFSEFESVDGPVNLERRGIDVFVGERPAVIRIGDPFGMGHHRLAVRPFDDRILHRDLDGDLYSIEVAATIWHYIVTEGRMLRDYGPNMHVSA